MEVHRSPFHHILYEREPPEQCMLESQQLIWVLNAAGMTAETNSSVVSRDLQMTSSIQLYAKKILASSYTFEYPKSHIFRRGAGLPSKRVFSNFKSL